MNSIRLFRLLAWVNLAAGVLMGCSVLVGAGNMAMKKEITLLPALFVAVLLAIGYCLIHAARVHLKQANQGSALGLAANTAVVIWVLGGHLLRLAGLEKNLGPAYGFVAIVVAYLCYRLALKPAALRDFIGETEKT
jgi:hypothetical protein